MGWHEVILLILTILEASISLTTTTATPLKTSRSYKIVNTNSTCSAQELKIRLELNRNFRGVIYAKGFPLEKNCKSFGNNETYVDISLNTSGCGVRLVPINDETLSYMVTLNVQMDKFLQQITDIEMTASCTLSPNDMIQPRKFKQTRTGRNQVPKSDTNDQEINLGKVRSWMEIEGTSESNNVNRVSVGEQTILLIKSMLPGGFSVNVVDCFAHDGTGDVTQRLTDENGCPIDENIMLSLELLRDEEETENDDDDYSVSNEITWDAGEDASPPPKSELAIKNNKPKQEKNSQKFRRRKNENDPERNRSENIELIPEEENSQNIKSQNDKMILQVVGTMFSAFKFPDAANLHLKCTLEICKEFCPKAACDQEAQETINRSGKSLRKREPGDIVEKIEVFNSVEVVAPGIDTNGFSSDEDIDEVKTTSGEKTFCLSASKMAFSFAILGAIFLCGVLAALWTVMRSHVRKMAKSFDGSEQILVVRDSPLNLTNPRGKSYTSWSYT